MADILNKEGILTAFRASIGNPNATEEQIYLHILEDGEQVVNLGQRYIVPVRAGMEGIVNLKDPDNDKVKYDDKEKTQVSRGIMHRNPADGNRYQMIRANGTEALIFRLDESAPQKTGYGVNPE